MAQAMAADHQAMGLDQAMAVALHQAMKALVQAMSLQLQDIHHRHHQAMDQLRLRHIAENRPITNQHPNLRVTVQDLQATAPDHQVMAQLVHLDIAQECQAMDQLHQVTALDHQAMDNQVK